MSSMKISTFSKPRPRIAVISHERSGTHFLMNSMASAFGYISHPWLDFDYYEANVNFYHPPSVVKYFSQFDSIYLANTVKSHHHHAFFSETMDQIAQSFLFLYIYRDPRNVMSSLCSFLNNLSWREGPRTASPSQLIRTAPCGFMMRYQMNQEPNMLSRWTTHVTGWLDAAELRTDHAIIPVRYEDLSANYAETIATVGRKIGLDPVNLEKPRADERVILPNKFGPGGGRTHQWTEEDNEFFRKEAGALMHRIGYSL